MQWTVALRQGRGCETISYGTRKRSSFTRIFFFHMLWLVLGLVLVCFCGLWPQKLGTRRPCPKKIRGSSDKNGTRNPTKNAIESFRIKSVPLAAVRCVRGCTRQLARSKQRTNERRANMLRHCKVCLHRHLHRHQHYRTLIPIVAQCQTRPLKKKEGFGNAPQIPFRNRKRPGNECLKTKPLARIQFTMNALETESIFGAASGSHSPCS